MLLQIVHVNGDLDDINSKLHDKDKYLEYLPILENGMKRTFDAGFELVYQPHTRREKNPEKYFSLKADYLDNFDFISYRFPFLKNFKKYPMYVLPSGTFGPLNYGVLSQIIVSGNHEGCLVGGMYKRRCVADVSRGIKRRNPQVDVKIAEDLTFDHIGESSNSWGSVPLTKMRDYF